MPESVAGFDGEITAHSALYYYRARHYDPKVGRFLQGDPVAPRPREMNRYVYVMNNPANNSDPYGEAVCANDSGKPFFYKPEHENNIARECLPGQWCDVDGIYTPDHQVIKIPDFCFSYYTADGDVVAMGPCRDRDLSPPRVVCPDELVTWTDWPNPYTGTDWPCPRW